MLRSVLKDILETAGYVVLATASLGTAAEELARCKIDLVITHPYVNNIRGTKLPNIRVRDAGKSCRFYSSLESWMMTGCYTARTSKDLRFFRRPSRPLNC